MNRTSLTLESYYTPHLKGLLNRISDLKSNYIALVGFSDSMKWLSRILPDAGIEFDLYDWRSKFVGFDSHPKKVVSLSGVQFPKETVVVICVDQINEIQDAVSYLVNSDISHLPTIWEFAEPYAPLLQQEPYKSIYEHARKRAKSVNTPDRLFNLSQMVRESENVKGDIVEFGTYAGGSSAIIVETLKHFAIRKQVSLFDSYAGIPESSLGVDSRWTKSFSNISLSEVKNAFSDCANVTIFDGPIGSTYQNADFPISFAHIDVDTYECAKLLTEFLWPNISSGGAILYDDYGFMPNCIPLTTFVDEFAQKQPDVFRFFLPSNGYILMKR